MKVITKNSGINDSERYLSNICEKTFLSLWSYPNLYTDEGKKSENGDGKELCDLLVVFENHVILFSDKDIAFKDTGNIEVDWGRWVKKAVIKSAAQLYGAESWITNHPERIYLDSKCNNKFPLRIPKSDTLKIHRIAVAKNATKKFASYTGGSGSLIITPSIVANDHLKNPFQIGLPVENKPYVHIFDDIALDTVLYELDTISDFIDYLEKKEIFITTGKLISCAGEEDLLAFYLLSASSGTPPGFYVDSKERAIIMEGQYKKLTSLIQYQRGKEYDKKSYFWDAFIEHFSKHALDGTLISTQDIALHITILGLQAMASERRIARRVLATSVLDKISNTSPELRAVRVILSPTNPDRGYLWLAEPIPPQAKTYEDYRRYRQELLNIYCSSAKLMQPQLNVIVGIATEPYGGAGGEDMIYLDTTAWDEKDYAQAKVDREEFNLFAPEKTRKYQGTEYQYPIIEGDYALGKKETKVSKKNFSKALRKKQKQARKVTRQK